MVSASPATPPELLNRANYTDIQTFRAYECEVLQLTLDTQKRHWNHLKHLLEWAGPQPFSQAPTLRPTFPQYLAQIGQDGQVRADGKTGPLAVETVSHACQTARTFLQWAQVEYPQRYEARTLTANWLASLKPARTAAALPLRTVYTHTEVEQLSHLPAGDTLTTFRNRAAVAFLFLSAMRVDAFVTMPLRALDLTVRPAAVIQDPAWGMRTKNRKAAITYLLTIPTLLEVVREWDALVRAHLSPEALWFATLSTDGMAFTGRSEAGVTRGELVADGLKALCQQAGLPYRSPHKLRHGHAMFALTHARDLGDLKALSQNLMHASVMTTDSIYGVLSAQEIAKRIPQLSGQQPTKEELSAEALALAQFIIQELRKEK